MRTFYVSFCQYSFSWDAQANCRHHHSPVRHECREPWDRPRVPFPARLRALRFLPPLYPFVLRLTDAALSRKPFRMITAQTFDAPFAHLTTKIESFARIAGTDERTHFDCCLPTNLVSDQHKPITRQTP